MANDNLYTQKGLENKLEQIDEKLNTITVVLDRNTNSLQEHMRRTEINEQSIKSNSEALEPIQKHVTQVENTLKVLGIIGGGVVVVGGLILTTLQIIKAFSE